MTLAASIDGSLIMYIAFAAYGVFAWWNDRRQRKAAEEEAARMGKQMPDQVSRGQQPSPPPRMETPEQERMRKFMEAIGFPTGSPPPPQPPPPQPAARPPQPASPTLAPRPIAMPVPRSMKRQAPAPVQKAYVPPAPKPRRTFVDPEPLPAESRDPGRLEEAASTVESVSTQFAHMHDRPMAEATLPSIAMAAAGNAPTTGVTTEIMTSQNRLLRELLRRPESLRTAIVLSEVLGPPKGA